MPVNTLYVNCIRFYSELQECSKDDFGYAWTKGAISPRVDMTMSEFGHSGVLFSNDVSEDFPPAVNMGTWHFNAVDDKYYVTLDLVNKTLTLLPVDNVLVLINDTAVPDLDNIGNYTSLNNLKEYLPAGEYSINLYSLYRRAWADISGLFLKNGNNYLLDYNTEFSDAPKGLLLDWDGGTLLGQPHGQLSLKSDGTIRGQRISSPQIYLIGDYCSWVFDSAIKSDAVNPEGTIFRLTMPEGVTMFKFTTEPTWESVILGFGGVITKDVDNQFVMNVDDDIRSDNFVFDKPLTEPLTVLLNLETQTVTLPANAPLTVNSQSAGENYEDYEDCLLLNLKSSPFKPWKDAPQSVMSTFGFIKKSGEDEWSGKVNVPAGEFSFNFISSLSEKGTPNKVIAPQVGRDRDLVFNDWYAFSSATEIDDTYAGYWTFTGWDGGEVSFTVSRSGDDYVLKVDDEAHVIPTQIYLIGMPNGWSIDKGNMPLYLTEKGFYCGAYQINAGEAAFRFYSTLGDWSTGSIGCQYFDELVDFSFGDDTIYLNAVNGGKGVWNFID